MKLIELEEIDSSLRDYQVESKKEIYKAWEKSPSVLFQMPTGTGKTRLFVSIIKDIQRLAQSEKKRHGVLVLAHRTELIEQISATIGKKYGIAHGIIKSGYDEERLFPVQVASVQTMIRRLESWKSMSFDYIIIDEAHHAMAKTYKKICAAYPDVNILGVTATPCRLSGEGLREIFGTLVLSQPVQKFIDQGWLSQYKYYSIAPESNIQSEIDDINDFAVDGDYSEKAMMDICDTAKVRADIVDSYQRFANGKKGIIYTINCEHNKHICDDFKEIGVNIKSIDSKTPEGERKQIVSDFRAGKVQIICNVNIFSEGFDCPDVEFIQLVRPTKSLSMYLQQVGRGLRPHVKKTHAIILDNVGSYNRFGLPSANRKWRKHFEGYGVDGEDPTQRKKKRTEKRQYDFDEGGEEMMLIYEGLSKQTRTVPDESNLEIEEVVHFPVAAQSRILNVLRSLPHELIHYFAKYECFYNLEYERWHEMIDECIFFYIDLCEDNYKDETSSLLQDYYDAYSIPIFKVKINGKYGLFDGGENRNVFLDLGNNLDYKKLRGNYSVLLEPVFDEIRTPDTQDRFICVKDGKYGVINGQNMCIVIPFKYDNIEQFDFEKYIVEKKGSFGIAGADGIIIPLEYEYMEVSDRDFFNDREKTILYAVKNGKEGFFVWDYFDNEIKGLFQITRVSNWGNKYIGKVGDIGLVFIDESGKLIIPCLFSKIARFRNVSNQLPIYAEKGYKYYKLTEDLEISEKGVYGKIKNKQLEMVIGLEQKKEGNKTKKTKKNTIGKNETNQSKKIENGLSKKTDNIEDNKGKVLSNRTIHKKFRIIQYENICELFIKNEKVVTKTKIKHIEGQYFAFMGTEGLWELVKYSNDGFFDTIKEAEYEEIEWDAESRSVLLYRKDGRKRSLKLISKYNNSHES